jgi:hypothetical protein
VTKKRMTNERMLAGIEAVLKHSKDHSVLHVPSSHSAQISILKILTLENVTKGVYIFDRDWMAMCFVANGT